MKNDVYCNPLSLPDIGPGICCRQTDPDINGFSAGKISDFREISDPEMLYHDGVWYMYPSVRQVYVSRDLAHWEYHPIDNADDLGYAPSVVCCRGRFLLTASVLLRNPVPRIYEAPTPEGPFTLLGEPRLMDGSSITPEYLDPSLFVDDDGRLYLYWGWGYRDDGDPTSGVYGMELDPVDPTKAISEKVKILDLNPANDWERFGEANEHLHRGADEGVAMFKHNGEYYLQYACCGTVFRNYALGCYRSKVSPLGPFTPPRQFMARSQHGMVAGTGHGGMVAGPNGTVWQFYTCTIRRIHMFERRIGMDKVEFDANGEPYVPITATPQSVSGGDCGWLPVGVGKFASATSFKGENYPSFATDDCTHTWWEPDPSDARPSLTVDLRSTFEIRALRIIWTEPELDYKAGKLPEPVRFTVDLLAPDGKILETIDHSGQSEDRNVEFLLVEHPVAARFVRLNVLREKNKYRHGVTDFSIFAPAGGPVECRY